MKKAAVLLVLCVLCACTASDNSQTDQTAQQLTIVLWDYDKISYDRRLVEAFEQAHTGVQVKVISYPDAYYDEKMKSLLISGKEIDVFLTRTSSSLKTLCDYGIALPLEELGSQYGLDLADSLNDWDVMRHEGHLYGIPYRNDRYVLLYNCDLFDKAGVDYPPSQLTWEQFHTIARQLQQGLKDNNTGLKDNNTYAVMILPMDLQWIGCGRAGDLNAQAISASMRPIMDLLLEMQSEGCTLDYGACIAQDIQQQCFELGNYGMYVGGSWYINYLTSDWQSGKFNFRWGVTTAPFWPQQDAAQGTVVLSCMGICKNTKNKNLAWEFIQFATGAQGAAIMAEEQMIPAYMDEMIKKIYQENFIGARLNPEICKPRVYSGTGLQSNTAEYQIICHEFRKCMIKEKSVDNALADMRSALAILEE